MIIKPVTYSYPNLSKIKDPSSFFEEMKVEYSNLLESNFFNVAKKSAIFVYRIQAKTRIYHGIIAGIDIDEYLKGKILKHENTLPEQEKKISLLTLQRKAIIKPVLLAHKFNPKISSLITKGFLGKKPRLRIKFDKDNQIHELFAIESLKEIKAFQKEFKSKIDHCYIADGHHRMSTIKLLIDQNPELKNQGLNYILCALFSFTELDILPYNRLVHILDILELSVILKEISNFASIKKLKSPRLPNKKGEIILHSSQGDYSILWHKEIINRPNKEININFDIDLFNEFVLNIIFDIKDIRSNPRIHYVEGTKGNKLLLKGIAENKELIGFSFFPIKKTHFIKIANKNLILPPKSTWFEPRIKNGIIVQKIFE
ncbi:MAG: DUF1015 family protein [Saprospiraceae bacterium]